MNCVLATRKRPQHRFHITTEWPTTWKTSTFFARNAKSHYDLHDNFFVRWTFLPLLYHQLDTTENRTFHRYTLYAKTNGLRNRDATLTTFVVNERRNRARQGKAPILIPLHDLLWFEIHTLANSHETKKIDTHWARTSWSLVNFHAITFS